MSPPSSEIIRASIGRCIARFAGRAIKISLIKLGAEGGGRAGVESAGKRACSTRAALINPESGRLLAPFRAASSWKLKNGTGRDGTPVGSWRVRGNWFTPDGTGNNAIQLEYPRVITLHAQLASTFTVHRSNDSRRDADASGYNCEYHYRSIDFVPIN